MKTAQRGGLLGLCVLSGINLFNYVDRYVVPAVAESLKKDPDLHLSDAQLGWVMTGFIIVYAFASPVFGWLGDRRGRNRLVAAGVGIWSLATAAAGLTHGFASLFAARSTVGIGEAAYGSIAPTMLADYFPKAQRGRVFAIFFAAIPIGSALGYVLGGKVDVAYGWRAAFFVAGLPGLVLAGLCLLLRDPERGAEDPDDAGGTGGGHGAHGAPAKAAPGTYAALIANPAYVSVVLGYAAYTFALGGIAAWMPAFLERERGFTHSEATVNFGAIVVVTGFIGTFVGGWLGDLVARRTRQGYLWVSGIATLLAAPAAYLAFQSTDRTVELGALATAEVLIFLSTGPINSAIVNVVAPDMRATAMAMSILAIHVLGDVPSPTLIGMISDASSLARAVLIVPVAVVVSGVIWCAAAFVGGKRGWAS
jgi:MFS family permease